MRDGLCVCCIHMGAWVASQVVPQEVVRALASRGEVEPHLKPTPLQLAMLVLVGAQLSCQPAFQHSHPVKTPDKAAAWPLAVSRVCCMLKEQPPAVCVGLTLSFSPSLHSGMPDRYVRILSTPVTCQQAAHVAMATSTAAVAEPCSMLHKKRLPAD